MMNKIENAYVESVDIRLDRDFFVSPWVMLSGDSWSVGFGGIVFGFEHTSKRNAEIKTNALALYVARLLWVFEESSLLAIAGKPCRARVEGPGGSCLAVGNFTKDRWISREDITAMFETEACEVAQ